VRVELARVPDRPLDRFTRLAGQPQDEGAVRRDAEVAAVAREPPRDVQAEALLDIVQDPLVARLVADEQQPQAVVLQDLQRLVRHVRLGVARPRDAEPAEPPGDRLGTWQVVGERVVVEEVFLHLREVAARPRDLGDDVVD